jgi:hypothetical protein
MGIWKDVVKSGIRWMVNIALGWLVLKGVISSEESTAWSGEIVAGVAGLLITLLWAFWDKFKSWLFGKLAMEAPANISPQAIKARIKRMPKKKAIEKVLDAETTAPTQGAKENHHE